MLRIKKAFAWVSLFLEKTALACWQPLTFTLIYLALALVFTLPLWAYGLWLIATLLLFLKGFKEWHLPTRQEINNTLESRSGVKDRPIESLEDTTLTEPTDFQSHLWRASQDRQRATLKQLHFLRPFIRLENTDQHALRIAAVLLFIIAFVISGQYFPQKIKTALWPFTQSDQSNTVLTVTPPLHIKKPVTRNAGFKREVPIDIYEGSQIAVTHAQPILKPKLTLNDKDIPFKNNVEETVSKPLDTIILSYAPLLKQQWSINYIEDKDPTIHTTGAPDQSSIGALEIPVSLYDDFGIKEVNFAFDLDPVVEEQPLFGAPYKETKALNTNEDETLETSLKFDVTAHLWSGLPVTLTLQATDFAGQISEPLNIETVLPERSFLDERAQKLIAARKRLAWEGVSAYPDILTDTTPILESADLERLDISIYLAAKTLIERIKTQDKDILSTIELLWTIALELEDQGLTREYDALKKAIQDLMKALQDNADDKKLAQKFGSLSEQLDSYVDKLAENMKEKSKQKFGDKTPDNIDDMVLSQEDFDSFMEDLLRNLQKGQGDQAQDKLSRLEDFIDNIVPDLNDELPPEIDFSMKSIDELDRLIEAEEDLLKRTKEAAQNLTTTQPLALEQNALRLILGQLIAEAAERLDDIPQGLGMAELEMRVVTLDLQQNKAEEAIPHEEKVIEYLREGQEELEQQLQEQIAQMLNPLGKEGLGDKDPLGRPIPGGKDDKTNPLNDNTVKIPDEAEQKRLREILNILRERAGEYDRPEEELDYIRKLLEKF
jgi:hypothetical protein